MTNSEEDSILKLLEFSFSNEKAKFTDEIQPVNRIDDIQEMIMYRLNQTFVTEETSLERIERKVDTLTKEVATRDDLIEQTNVLLENQKQLNEELIVKLQTLQDLQINNVAHRRLSRYSTVFLTFFSFSFLLRIFLNITIVTPFWNNVGLLISIGFLAMAWAMGKDWKKVVGGRG